MAATTQPAIAHGIATLSSEQRLNAAYYTWGPEWSLPPDRRGRWVIDKIYNTAIRVVLSDDLLPFASETRAWDALKAARETLSPDEEAKRTQWLAWADKREAAAFVRMWNVRKRREYGGIPTVLAGAFVRASEYSGVWHIATGQNGTSWDPEDRLTIVTECVERVSIDLGAEEVSVNQTTDPDRVCKRCTARIASREAAAPADAVMVPA